MADYILAIDQGTTSSRAIIFDKKGSIIALGSTVMNMSGKTLYFDGLGKDNPPQMGLKFNGAFQPDAKTYREVRYGG